MIRSRARKHVLVALALLLLAALFLIGFRAGVQIVEQKLIEGVNARSYVTYYEKNPARDERLLIDEWSSFRMSGAEFYLNGRDHYLGEITTNEYLPFAAGKYEIIWGDGAVTVRYAYSSSRNWMEAAFAMS